MATETRDNRASTLRSVAGTAGVLFCHFTALVILTWVSVSVLSRYIMFCSEWNLKLPYVTVYAIALSRWMSAYWYLLVLGLVPDGIVYFMLARLNPKLNWCAAVWAVVPLVLTIVILGLVATAMCLPLQQLSPSQHDTTAEPLRGQLR